MAALDSVEEISDLLDAWDNESNTENDCVNIMTKMAEVIEKANEAYMKQDPDPFDDRHPSRAHPDCSFGHILKKVFSHKTFVNTLLSDYLTQSNNNDLCVVSCRILLDVSPGLRPEIFEETDGLVNRLISWIQDASNLPQQYYAIALLAITMGVQDIAAQFKEQNATLVPGLLSSLHELSAQYFSEQSHNDASTTDRPFAHLNCESQDRQNSDGSSPSKSPQAISYVHSSHSVNKSGTLAVNDVSNSSWTEVEPMLIGSCQIYPLTLAIQQRFILQYLTVIGEYHELMNCVFEDPDRVLNLLFRYIDLREHKDIRLTFDALKYIAALICHKKCALKFIAKGGVARILKVHRQSLAATGVSFVLYYLGYCEDVMKKVCLLSHQQLTDLVSYALWLLECSHDSGRCHSTMFFGFTFCFKVIRELFVDMDGLRKLYNIMSTLDIFVYNENRLLNSLSADDIFGNRQTARQVCIALRRCFDGFLAEKAAELRHERLQDGGTCHNSTVIEANLKTLAECMSSTSSWKPVIELIRLDGITFLLRLIALHFEWNYSGRVETVRCALDVLTVCTMISKAQLALCNNITVMEQQVSVGMSIILQCAFGEIFSDGDIRRAALNIVINCVCGPLPTEYQQVNNVTLRYAPMKRKAYRNTEDYLSKMWNCVRSNNGIMVLRSLLTIKSPITDADSIRALACKALCGLARCDRVKQVVSKLPLFRDGQLQVLMREPVLQDKKQEHAKFVKYCIRLIEMVKGTPLLPSVASSIQDFQKAEIVAQTVISYSDKQLLQLIGQHLVQKGFMKSAAALQEEAHLESVTPKTPPQIQPVSHAVNNGYCSPANNTSVQNTNSQSGSHLDFRICAPPKLAPPPPPSVSHSSNAIGGVCSEKSFVAAKPSSSSVSVNMEHIHFPTRIKNSQMHRTKKYRSPLQKPPVCSGTYIKSPVMKRQIAHAKTSRCFTPTLDSIITEYLRSKHALCKNPYVTCPAFDLFRPHQCPESKYKNPASSNIALRMLQRQVLPQYTGCSGARLNKLFLNTRFRDIRAFQDPDDYTLLSCAFSSSLEHIYIGNLHGDLKVFGIESGEEVYSFKCHDSDLTNIQTLKKSNLVLTSASWRRPVSTLWDSSNLFELLFSFNDECYAEFSKLTQDRIIGTNYDSARIYDITTGRVIKTLKDSNSNHYTRNKATFSPTDELVLSDGVIYDVNSGKPIHKLDKFNSRINGVFHPSGLEIISNSEVWDLRTYRLLHTVPDLEQCKIIFDSTGSVIYGAILSSEVDDIDDPIYQRYVSSIRTFNAVDYTCIATKDVQKEIYEIAINPIDTHLAVIQNGMLDLLSTRESVCHIYEIGRIVEDDDQEGREEDDGDKSRDHSQDMDDDDDEEDDDDDDENDDDDDNFDGALEGDDEEEVDLEEDDLELVAGNESDFVSDDDYFAFNE